MRQTLISENARIQEDADGFWLHVKASNGKFGAIFLNHIENELVRDAFIQWAKDNLDKVE